MAGKIANEEVTNHSTDSVPHNERMGKGSLTMAWWSICSAMFWLFFAAILAMGYGTINTIIGLVLSIVSYGIINSIITRYAIKTGLSVALFSRILFGSIGATFATLIFFATAIYYCAFEGSVIAVAIQAYFPSLSINIAYLIVILYSVPLVFGSVQTWLDKFNGFLLPFYLIGLVAAVVWAISSYGYSNAWLEMGPATPAKYGWWDCFVAFMGVWILMMYTWDYARYGKQEEDNYHAKFNFGMPFYLFTFLINGLVGIFLVATVPTEGGVTEVSVVLALLKLMGILGLVFVWVSQTRINTANFYLASTNMQSFFERFGLKNIPTFVWTIVVGIIVYLIMLTNIFSFILEALSYQAIFIVAWVGIAIAHIVSPKYEEIFGDKIEYRIEKVKVFNSTGLTALFVALIIGLGLKLFGGSYAGFASPVTAIVAFVVYYVMLKNAHENTFHSK